jgi:hypothetical protein
MGTLWFEGLREWWCMAPWASARRVRGRVSPNVLEARQEFLAMLADLGGGETLLLRTRIQRALSLRELWHLRAELFSLVAVQRSQTEAEDRLAWLNRYFPTRSPRSGFGALPMRELPMRELR